MQRISNIILSNEFMFFALGLTVGIVLLLIDSQATPWILNFFKFATKDAGTFFAGFMALMGGSFVYFAKKIELKRQDEQDLLKVQAIQKASLHRILSAIAQLKDLEFLLRNKIVNNQSQIHFLDKLIDDIDTFHLFSKKLQTYFHEAETYIEDFNRTVKQTFMIPLNLIEQNLHTALGDEAKNTKLKLTKKLNDINVEGKILPTEEIKRILQESQDKRKEEQKP